ncbi:MAG: type I restriction enzyme HsdR N-terminal domain-containing protein [Nitrospirae bacterium]|nr:type I restriction enzyme HsdR N-terminal domain-containing protein [Nitrospirota bacterium]
MSEASDRQKLIKERLKEEEDFARIQTGIIRQMVFDELKNTKDFSDEDIEIDREFIILLDGKEDKASVDFIIKIDDKRLASIKCSLASIESRERHILAFSRVVDEYIIPFSVVTDGIHARVMDTASGKLLSETLQGIPSKTELEILDWALMKCPEERLEKEKRILLAFQTISCPIDY